MRTVEAEANIAKAYARCGYQIKSLRVWWSFPFWEVKATVVRDGREHDTMAWRATRKRLVREVETTYAHAIYPPTERREPEMTADQDHIRHDHASLGQSCPACEMEEAASADEQFYADVRTLMDRKGVSDARLGAAWWRLFYALPPLVAADEEPS